MVAIAKFCRTCSWLLAALAIAGCGDGASDGETVTADSAWPSGLATPIRDATFNMEAAHLPGALRDYREGVHQGFDFPRDSSGRPLKANAAVVAVSRGRIIRIDHGYASQEDESLDFWSARSTEPGFVGAYALDQLRGRQVWLRHESGHVSRYAHLSSVNPDLALGDDIEEGEVLGRTGSSGLAPGVADSGPAPHLHFELRSPDGDRYLCQDRDPLPCHRRLRSVFGESSLPRYAHRVLTSVESGEAPPATYPPDPLPESGFSANPPDSMSRGAPVAIPVTWQGEAFEAADLRAYLDGRSMGIVDAGDGAWILATAPLGFAGDSALLAIAAVDRYGQVLAGSRDIEVVARTDTPPALEVESAVLESYQAADLESELNRLGRVSLESLEYRRGRWNSAFHPPLAGEITRRFGQPIYHGLLSPAFPLPGITISAAADATVSAANSGIVRLAENLPVRGLTVALDHGGGVVSVYGHLSRIEVEPGDSLEKGQALGRAGSTGAAGDARVRWEMYLAGVPTDPLAWAGETLPNRQAPAGSTND